MKMTQAYAILFFSYLLLVYVPGALGATLCASNSTELQNHLNTAAGNSQNDLIQVVQGTYSGSFYMNSNQGDNISILGGYTSGCSTRVVDPTNTILDATGTGSRVLCITNHNSTGGDITVDGFTIQNGAVDATDYDGDGAGLYLISRATSGTASGNIAVTNNIIKNNYAVYRGGGVFAKSEIILSGATAGTVTVTGNIVQGNTASGESYASGGGIYAVSYSNPGSSNNISIALNVVTNNDSGYGGGVYSYSYAGETSGNITITDNEIYTNTATDGDGGGIYAVTKAAGETEDSGTILIEKNIIAENTTSGGGGLGQGGGIYAESSCNGDCNGGNIELSGNSITQNQGIWGGGVFAQAYTYDGAGGDLRFESNTITGNISDRDGAGINAFTSTHTNTAGDMIFINNIIAGNIADDDNGGSGAGVRAGCGVYGAATGTAGDLEFTNNTITNNRSNWTGGIEIQGTTVDTIAMSFYNNIIHGNSYADLYSYNGTVTYLGYNNNTSFTSWDTGSGNINSTPEFKNPGSWYDNGTPADLYDDIWQGGDFHLKRSSPCIDTGTNSVPGGLPGTDFEGDSRQIDGDKDGTPTVDMGADEFSVKAITPILFLLLGS